MPFKFPLVLRSTYEREVKFSEVLQSQFDSLCVTNRELQAALARSQKNDTPRDPKTGRFVRLQ